MEPDTRVAGSINANAKAMFASSNGVNQMALMSNDSAELPRHQQLQHEEGRQIEAEEEGEGEEVSEDVELMTSSEHYPLGQSIQIGTRRFVAPVSFDDFSPSDVKRIALIQSFDRTALLADADARLNSLYLYTWDDKCLWCVSSEARTSRVLQRIITVDDVDFSSFDTIDVVLAPHVAVVAKVLQTFVGGPPIEEGVDVDIWWYHVYIKRPYVLNLCSFTDDEDLEAWRGRYMVHLEALLWSRAIRTAQFPLCESKL